MASVHMVNLKNSALSDADPHSQNTALLGCRSGMPGYGKSDYPRRTEDPEIVPIRLSHSEALSEQAPLLCSELPKCFSIPTFMLQ